MSLVGIDVGSSTVKAAAYRAGGGLLAQAAEPVPTLHPQPGAAEVNGAEVWDSVVRVLGRLTSHAQVRRDPPAALAVSASGREGFPARADGTPLGPCLRTADNRRPAVDAAVTLARPDVQWIKDCGHVPDHRDPTNRILWWNQQAPRVMSRARWFLGWHEQASLHLVGHPIVDPALAAGFAIFDLAANSWSAERIGALRIDARMLPEVAPWATPLGGIRPKIAEEIGLPRSCTLVAGSWDGSCAAVGAGVVEEGSALIAAGTWESVVAPVRRPRPGQVAAARLALTPQPSVPGLGMWARSPNGTSVLDWVLGVTGLKLRQLERALESAGADPSPALMVPHLAGAPAPWPEPDRAPGGALFGLTLATTKADLARAALEGIAFDLRLAIDALQRAGCVIRTCTVTGGGARSPWWLQLKADLLGLPVETCGFSEPGTFGAALLAGVGAGVYSSIAEAARQVGVAWRFEPDASRSARYEPTLAGHRDRARAMLRGVGEA